MTFKSEAYVVHEPGGPIAIEEVEFGDIATDEIVVETAAFSVCASDLKAAAGKFYLQPPLILGHECAGTVKDVGSGVRTLAVGDKVVLSYSSCQSCSMCLSGANPYCHSIRKLNFSGCRTDRTPVATSKVSGMPLAGLFFGQSSMGRHIVANSNCAVKLPEATTDDELRIFSTLGCGIQTGSGAILNVAKPAPNSSICIFGAGSVGLAACLAAALTSPSKLVIVDNSATKLAMLPDCVKDAVTDMLDSSTVTDETQLVDALKSLTPDGLGFDYALECVGRAELVKAGHLSLRPKGMVITVGGSMDMALQTTMSQHLTRGITYRGTHQGDSVPWISIPFLVDLWRRGKFPFDKLLTFYKFDELHRALHDLKEGKIIKAVLLNL